MADIFLSYARADKDAAAALARDFKEAGLNVFWDMESIKAGDEWQSRIQETLPKCQAVIYLATEESLHSKSVNNEIGMALSSKVIVVPVLIGITPAQLPSMVQKFQGVVISDWTSQEALREISKLVREQARRKQE